LAEIDQDVNFRYGYVGIIRT